MQVVYENGTNKADYLQGKVHSYEWQGLGSNYYMSEFLSAILFDQLRLADWITSQRKLCWNVYANAFESLQRTERLELLIPGADHQHNGHAFIIKARNFQHREKYIIFMASNDVEVAFHYKPLHTSPFGRTNGRFHLQDRFTTKESERLISLPIYPDLTKQQQDKVVQLTHEFFSQQ
ncbi:MAG: DegT/DnrJ/EryC1/StrS family aminotransferase [Bacteroidetes bacterium]|nr:DegT/DnrJ/EryC1/StrS family aminotransferase [Bacteroidota bacterium]